MHSFKCRALWIRHWHCVYEAFLYASSFPNPPFAQNHRNRCLLWLWKGNIRKPFFDHHVPTTEKQLCHHTNTLHSHDVRESTLGVWSVCAWRCVCACVCVSLPGQGGWGWWEWHSAACYDPQTASREEAGIAPDSLRMAGSNPEKKNKSHIEFTHDHTKVSHQTNC